MTALHLAPLPACPFSQLAACLNLSGHSRISGVEEQQLAVQVLSRLPVLREHFRLSFSSTNEDTHLKLDYHRHLAIAADCSRVVRLRVGEEYHLPPRSQLHVLLQGRLASSDPLFVFAKKPLPKVSPDESFHVAQNVKFARHRIVSLAASLGMEESGLAKRMRDSEDCEEIMAVYAVLFFPPNTETRIDYQNGSAPFFPLGTADPELLKTFFATSFVQTDGAALEYIYKGQLLYQPIRRIAVGSELGSLYRCRDRPDDDCGADKLSPALE